MFVGHMQLDDILARRIFERADLCRAFEEAAFLQIGQGNIKIPSYLSAGQEYAAATLSVALEVVGIHQRQIFIQHRGHSTYLCFGGDIDELTLELLGDPRGCANGMGGSASIQSVAANIYGHDGLMGSHGPISVGMCYANRIPTICFVGDAAAEEDYFLGAIGWASTKRLPIIFVVEDNNLSILTEKKVRRSWEMDEVARGFRMKAFDVDDDPEQILACLDENGLFAEPMLLNIRTNRLFWHAGAGIDSTETFDRHKAFATRFEPEFIADVQQRQREIVEKTWQQHLQYCAK
ncbi:MAG: thiamine pyrophosphate-dependent enzyme [Methylococcaceae bacterium]